MNTKTTTERDKWVGQALNRYYLRQGKTHKAPQTHGKNAHNSSNQNNILLEYNLLLHAYNHFY